MATSPRATDITALNQSRTVLLETRKRDGTWVATPVSLAHTDGRLFFRTYDASGKAKRLRNFPDVRVRPCTSLGKVRDLEAASATARLLGGMDALQARRLLAKQFPVLHRLIVPTMHRLRGWATLHYELTLDA